VPTTPNEMSALAVSPGDSTISLLTWFRSNQVGPHSVLVGSGCFLASSSSFTAADTTRGSTQTVTTAAPYAGSMPLNSAQVVAMFSNSTVTPPPADTQIWQFAGSKVTTYRGDHGTILGPWATSRWIDTTDGTHAGAVVADASVLSTGRQEPPNAAGQAFGVWLRHR
jgi:hypothetical protein